MLFTSSLHCNQIQKGYPSHSHDANKPQETNTNWFSSVPGDHHHREANVYGALNFEHQHRNPTGLTPSPSPNSSWPRGDHFPPTMMQPMDYHPAEATGQPPAGKPAEGAHPLAQQKPQSFSLASLELLNNYGKGFKNAGSIREENFMNINTTIPTNEESNSTGNRAGRQKLALGEIIKVAGERYIQFSTQKVDGFSTSIHPYSSSVITSEVSTADMGDVELVQVLLIAAECVGLQQFDLARALITRCLWISDDDGNPAQRIVFYFAEALQGRVDIETGRTTMERLTQQSSYARGLELDFNLAFLACHQALPFIQVTQFAAMQTVADNFKSANKIHLVDLHIRSGVQWTVLMQALAERDDPPEIRITAVGTTNMSHVEEAGKRLHSFAQSLNLSFSFNSIVVSDMKELKEDMFGKEPEEAVAVYASLILRTMLSQPDSLGNVMRVMRRLKPTVVVVTEVEANHNSPSFISRFTESLFFYSAFFDCLEDCMERKNEHRKTVEGIYLGEGIRNMVGTEGDKRCTRNVKMDVWREYFGRYGMAEVELGEASVRQANLILKKFPKAGSCNLTAGNGKGLLIGWKGTPIHSLSTWKFAN